MELMLNSAISDTAVSDISVLWDSFEGVGCDFNHDVTKSESRVGSSDVYDCGPTLVLSGAYDKVYVWLTLWLQPCVTKFWWF